MVTGWNFVTGTTATSDSIDHGTATTGTTAAATNDGTRVAGFAWANPVMPLVVLDSTGYASYSNIASAIIFTADHGIRGDEYQHRWVQLFQYVTKCGELRLEQRLDRRRSSRQLQHLYSLLSGRVPKCVSVSATDSSNNLA
jgi:subtilisin family serine protease